MEGRHLRTYRAARAGRPAKCGPKWRQSMTTPTFAVSSRARLIAMALVVFGAVVAIYGLYVEPERTWPNLLLNGFYVASLGVSSIFFLMTQRLTGARWSASLRRVPEALMSIVPVAALLILAL